MKRIIKSAIIKVVILIIVWTVAYFLHDTLMPVLTNEIALRQFEMSSASYMDFAAWTSLWRIVWSALSLSSAVSFMPNIVAFFKTVKESE